LWGQDEKQENDATSGPAKKRKNAALWKSQGLLAGAEHGKKRGIRSGPAKRG